MREVYNWVPWFKELAEKIAIGGKEYLVECAHKVDWQSDDPPILKYGSENIDPFSFFYFLAQKNTTNQREPVYKSCKEVFNLESDMPCLFWDGTFVFPRPSPNVVTLFHDGKDFSSNQLWEFFLKATQNLEKIASQEFFKLLSIPQVGLKKLSQCLYLIAPDTFIPADDTLKNIGYDLRKLESEQGWNEYLKIIDELRIKFSCCETYEIARLLY
ncbi:MAG: hypothetical protein F4Y22_10795, partial [Gammaproteobacteria bacterium]|nr:hypothetical protein [Gammaproteobacteria bacterium]